MRVTPPVATCALPASTGDYEHWSRSVFDQAPAAMAVMAHSGAWLDTNRALRGLLGYSADELLKATTCDLMHPADRDAHNSSIQPVVRREVSSAECERRFVHKLGHVVHLRMRTTLLDRGDGLSDFLVAQFEDVSLHRPSQDILRESEERYRVLAENSTDIIFRHSPGGICLYASPASAVLLGYATKELLGRRTSQLLHPDDRPGYLAWMESLARTKGESLTYRIRRKDGSYLWLESTAKCTLEAGTDKVLEVQSSARDVTQRRAAEERLQRSEASFRALIERSPDALIVHREGVIVYLNPSAVRFMRRSEERELLGTSVFDQLHEDDRKRAEERSRAAHEGTKNPPAELRYKSQDGEVTLAEVVSLGIVFDSEPAVLVVLRDLTERKKLEAQLLLSDRMASIGTLAAGVAHEINNPLAYVLANLSFAIEQIEGPASAKREGQATAAGQESASFSKELRQALKEALLGGERMRQIVKDLKTVSRGDEEKRSPVDVQQVLESSLNIAWSEIRQRATLVRAYGTTPKVLGNEARLGQVFLNLLVNAAQAIPEGQLASNTIRVATFAKDAAQVVVEISDSGAGIPAKVLGRIFDPFFTTKPVGEGTGLGLSICHSIVLSLGGEITVASEPGKGTTFRVLLPSCEATVLEPEPVEAPAVRAGARILAVDDERMILRSLKRLLASSHELVGVSSAGEALEVLRSGQPFDVILCDLMMPGMSGMDLYATLLAERPEDARRMVFVSGGALSPRAREFTESVPNAKVDKPFDLLALQQVISKLLS